MKVLLYVPVESGLPIVYANPEAVKRTFADYAAETNDGGKSFFEEIDFAWEELGNEGDLGDGDYIVSTEVVE